MIDLPAKSCVCVGAILKSTKQFVRFPMDENCVEEELIVVPVSTGLDFLENVPKPEDGERMAPYLSSEYCVCVGAILKSTKQFVRFLKEAVDAQEKPIALVDQVPTGKDETNDAESACIGENLKSSRDKLVTPGYEEENRLSMSPAHEELLVDKKQAVSALAKEELVTGPQDRQNLINTIAPTHFNMYVPNQVCVCIREHSTCNKKCERLLAIRKQMIEDEQQPRNEEKPNVRGEGCLEANSESSKELVSLLANSGRRIIEKRVPVPLTVRKKPLEVLFENDEAPRSCSCIRAILKSSKSILRFSVYGETKSSVRRNSVLGRILQISKMLI